MPTSPQATLRDRRPDRHDAVRGARRVRGHGDVRRRRGCGPALVPEGVRDRRDRPRTVPARAGRDRLPRQRPRRLPRGRPHVLRHPRRRRSRRGRHVHHPVAGEPGLHLRGRAHDLGLPQDGRGHRVRLRRHLGHVHAAHGRPARPAADAAPRRHRRDAADADDHLLGRRRRAPRHPVHRRAARARRCSSAARA